MIDESVIYWISRLDHIHDALCLCIPLSIIGVTVSIAAGAMIKDLNDCKILGNRILYWCSSAFVCVFLLTGLGKVFLPTTKEMAAIKVIPAVMNNESMNELGNGLMELSKAWLEEFKPKNMKK